MRRMILGLLIAISILSACHPSGLQQETVVPTVDGIPREVGTPTVDDTLMEVAALAVTPLPKYLLFVAPNPGESLTITEYKELAISLGWDATMPGICLSVSPGPLLEAGDTPTAEEWLGQMSLIVDDKVITEYHSLLKTDSLGGEWRDPTTQELIKKEPEGSPLRVCYAATLGVGQHTVTVVVEKSSGELATYTWTFALTE